MDIIKSLEELLLTVDQDLEKELAESIKEAILSNNLCNLLSNKTYNR